MLNYCAFGHASRPRREDDVGRIVWRGALEVCVPIHHRLRQRLFFKREHDVGDRSQGVRIFAGAEHNLCVDSLSKEFETSDRMGRVQRYDYFSVNGLILLCEHLPIIVTFTGPLNDFT